MKRTAKELGRLGEIAFEQTCGNFPGVVVNRSLVDERGWDHLVEFPPAKFDGPIDLQPPGLNVFVQVKSTENASNKTCSLKLSNAFLFVQRPDPCFVVLFQFRQGEKAPFAAYVVHFWNDLIGRTIKRLRQSQAKGQVKINKLSFSIRFTEKDLVAVDELPELLSRTAMTFKNYATTKRKLVTSSGTGGSSTQFDIKFQTGLKDADFVDLALGLREDLPFNNFRPSSVRFGIPLPLGPNIDEGSGKLKMTVIPSAKGNMLFHRNHGSDLSIPAEIFYPSAFPFIAAENIRMRIITSFFDLVTAPKGSDESTMTLSFDVEKKLLLSELAVLLNLMVNHAGETIKMQCRVEHSVILRGTITIPQETGFAGLDDWQRACEFLISIEKQVLLYRWPKGFRLSIEEISNSSSMIIRHLAFTNREDILIIPQDQDEIGNADRYVTISATFGKLGDQWLVSLVKHSAGLVSDERGKGLKLTEPVLLSCYPFPAKSKKDAYKAVKDELLERSKAIEQDENMPCVIFGPLFD